MHFFSWVHHKTLRKNLEQRKPLAIFQITMKSMPRWFKRFSSFCQFALIFFECFIFLNAFQDIISFSIFTALHSCLKLLQSSQMYMSKDNTFFQTEYGSEYMLQFSHTCSPTEFQAFSKLNILYNSFHNQGQEEQGSMGSEILWVLCSVAVNLQTLKYQLLLMSGNSNVKIVSIIPNYIKNRAFNTSLGKRQKYRGLL